jgi:CBS-domain-containing membrane protein
MAANPIETPAMRNFFLRHQPHMPPRTAILAGIGALLGIAALGLAGDATGMVMLFAPLGATCVLLFSLPASPLSQPMNVVLGHALSGALGLGAQFAAPGHLWVAAVAVGIAITGMGLLRLTHPPAGATTLVSYFTGAGWTYLAFPILTGAAALVIIAAAYHRATGTAYPIKAGRA